MADFVSIDDKGNPHIDLSGVKRRQLAAVGAVEGSIIEEGRVVKAPKIRTHDKLKALDMLARLARLYPADRASARCRFGQVANVESEYQMGAIVTGRPVGRPITSTIGKPREVWPWAMKLLFGSPVFLSYWPLPLK